MADDVPSARTFNRVDARVLAANGDGAGRYVGPGRRQTRRMKSRVEIAEVWKSRRETEQVNLVDGGRVELANLLNRQATVFCHPFEVPAIVDDRDFLHGARAVFRGD